MKPLYWLLPLLLAGCVNLGSTERPARTVYQLGDAGSSLPAATRDARTLLLMETAADPYFDAEPLVYSRAPGTLARYRFAVWSARPGKRYAQLLRTRLEQAAVYATVAQAGGMVSGELALDTRLVDFRHDAAQSPGVVVVAVEAELVDLDARRLIERRRFEARVPAASHDAAGAATAFDTATAKTLDELIAWLAGAR